MEPAFIWFSYKRTSLRPFFDPSPISRAFHHFVLSCLRHVASSLRSLPTECKLQRYIGIFVFVVLPKYQYRATQFQYIKADSLTTNGRRLFTSAFPFMVNDVSTGGGKEQQSWA